MQSSSRSGGVSIAPGLGAVTAYFLASVPPPPGTVAIQIPVQFQGIPVATRDFIARAHADGFAVHVFPDAGEEGVHCEPCRPWLRHRKPPP